MPIYFRELLELSTSLMGVLALMLIAVSILRTARLQHLEQERRRRSDTLLALSGEKNLWVKFAELGNAREHGIGSEDDPRHKRLTAFLTRLELIALGVNQGVYDEEIARRIVGDLMSRTFLIVRKEFYELRAAADAPSYVEFEALVRRWQSDEAGDTLAKRRARVDAL